MLAVLLVKFFLVLKVIFFKINERATLPEMEKEKKIKEGGGRRQRRENETGKRKRKKQENKKQKYTWLNLHP